MKSAVGYYNGDGATSHYVTGLGFQPDAVLIMPTGGSPFIMPPSGGLSVRNLWTGVAFTALAQPDGFVVDINANLSGQTYHYWATKIEGAAEVNYGGYTGNNTDNRNVLGLGFRPALVLVYFTSATSASSGAIRTDDGGGDLSYANDGAAVGAGYIANVIQSMQSDGFQVGTDAHVNVSPTNYWWVAWATISSHTKVLNYTGDGTDNRNITGAGFQPAFVLITREEAGGKSDVGPPVFKTAAMDGESTGSFTISGAGPTNKIQSFQSDGFQVGTDNAVNKNGAHYHAFCALASVVPQPNPISRNLIVLQSRRRAASF